MPVLFCLTLVQTLTDASIHHDVRRDRVERHDRQMTPAYVASDEQGRDMKLSLLTSTGWQDSHEGEEGPGNPRSLLLSLVLLLFLLCNMRFPFAYKRGSRAPHEKGDLDTRA